MEFIHVTHLTYSASLEDWSFSIKAKYARLRTSRGRRMRLRESFFSGRISRPSSKVSPSANYNKIESEGQTSNLHFIVISLRADGEREMPHPPMSKIHSAFQPMSGIRTFRPTRRIIPNNADDAQWGLVGDFTLDAERQSGSKVNSPISFPNSAKPKKSPLLLSNAHYDTIRTV